MARKRKLSRKNGNRWGGFIYLLLSLALLATILHLLRAHLEAPQEALTSNAPPVALIKTNVPPAKPPAKSNAAKETPEAEKFENGDLRAVQNVFEAQLSLASIGISVGSIDGVAGFQSRQAFRAFQKGEGIAMTGELDAETKQRLLITPPIYIKVFPDRNDLLNLQRTPSTWLGKSQQSSMDYENALEMMSEKHFSHPGFIRRLNPGLNWTNIEPTTYITVPNVQKPVARTRVASIHISLSQRSLQGFDFNGNMVCHFPCSIAQRVEKRPLGQLRVMVVAPNPNYVFDPANFPESAEGKILGRKLVIPPGPNNPVGTAWIGLDKPGYGIHGTPRPEDVGRTESHGCFRLANWNAEYLTKLVSVGIPVYVEH